MADGDPERFKQSVRDAAAWAEEELRHVVSYINDKVVPDVRRDGSNALRAAAAELEKIARRMDDRKAAAAKETEATAKATEEKDPHAP